MELQLRDTRLLPLVCLLLLVSTLGVAQQFKTEGQTNKNEPTSTADNLKSITFKPVGEGGKRVSVVIRTSEEMREKEGLPKTITVGFNGEPVDFKRKRGGKYEATVRLKGDEALDTTETLDLARGSIREEHYTRAAAVMVLRCNTRAVPCDQNCRSAKSHAPCMMCLNTCGIEWKSSSKK
ncbi:hypothetical protein [Edaphobacter aggregans]|uniref:hypothetical protein n=1 Tax=Edaphobacter aggregans TaxID=570835 RepID=UPI000553AE5C|nr:hypothetical protein [Edaphobacter aggregans]